MNKGLLWFSMVSLGLWACGDDPSSESATGTTQSADGGGTTSGSGDGGSNGSAGTSGGDAGSSSSGSGTGTTSSSGSGTGTTSSSGSGTGTTSGDGSAAAQIAEKLGRDHFLIGMGNDLEADHNEDGAYTLGVTLDLHYAYLVGLPGMGGWPDWNPDGSFVDILADVAQSKGVVPMFTTYSMAAWGENNLSVTTNADYMGPYWQQARLLFERLGAFDAPAVVHFEPDWWAYVQRANGDPSAVEVQVTQHASECADLPNTMVGMGRCMVKLARTYAPKTLVGFHASRWAADQVSDTIAYLNAIGAGEADIVVVEMQDRDAGCLEAATNPLCQRGGADWYWDETNQTSPNYHEHLDWAKQIAEGVGRPLMWWQLPFGVPSDTPGGVDGAYRDNRVRYVFGHIDEFVEAGGVGAVFGTGATGQTYITTDGGQFQRAVTEYFASPYPLE